MIKNVENSFRKPGEIILRHLLYTHEQYRMRSYQSGVQRGLCNLFSRDLTQWDKNAWLFFITRNNIVTEVNSNRFPDLGDQPIVVNYRVKKSKRPVESTAGTA